MPEPTLPRPRQVTVSGWVLMLGAVIVVALVLQLLTRLHTTAGQDTIRRLTDDLPDELAATTEGVRTWIRTLGMVAAGCATATGVLGYHVLQRSRSARLAATVLAVPLFLTGLLLGGLVSSMMAAAAVMLWLQPARSWFDGVPAPARRTPVERPAPPVPPERGQLPAGVWPAPYAASTDVRPPAVLWACVLTWVGSGVAGLGIVVRGITLDLDSLVADARRQNPDLQDSQIPDGFLVAVAVGTLVAIVLWCVVAAVLAVLVYRRVGWARIVLIVSASAAAVLSLAGSAFGAVLLLVPMLASVVAIALLARPDVRPWFDRRRPTPSGPPSPGGPVPPR